ncbi:MAG: hypothetical protein WDZ29_03305 [Balneolaceae bacterium]
MDKMKRTNWKSLIAADVKSQILPAWKNPLTSFKDHRIVAPLNLQHEFQAIERNNRITGFRRSRLDYIAHLILSHMKKDLNYFSTLRMDYMRNVVPQAGDYMDVLIRNGLVDRRGYSTGRNSQLYKFKGTVRLGFRMLTDQDLCRRKEKVYEALRKRNSKKYPYLNKWIRQVKIDRNGAMSQVMRSFNASTEPINKAEIKKTHRIGQIERIASGDLYIKYSQTERRLHTNVTNLASELLPYIHIDGNSFVEIDIRNSQPFFVISLFNPTPEIEQLIDDYLGEGLTSYIRSLEAIEREDVQKYISLVTSGKFYEYMAEVFRENGIPVTDRKEVKVEIFRTCFFGSRNTYKFKDGEYDSARVFKKTFPTIFRLFYRIKEQDTNRLAVLLQRIESYTMLERVVSRFEAELPGLPILTRHDSLLIPKSGLLGNGKNLDKALDIFTTGVQDTTGVLPQGRMTKLRPK